MINIEKEFNQKVNRLAEFILELPWEYRDFYAHWANQQFFLVQHSTRYLTYCASLVDLNDSKEFTWWSRHLSEEMGHDNVLLKDLERMGYQFKNTPCPEVRAIIGAQYYEIQKYGPDAQLGWALMLEGLSSKVCDEMADRIEKSIGSNITKYLRMHGKADGDHYPEGISRIAAFSEQRKEIILRNLELSSALYEYFLKKVRDEVQANTLLFEAA